jgi:hypothetical protein
MPSAPDVVQPVPLQAFIVTLRCVVNVESAVNADMVSERLRAICLDHLDEEEGDQVIVTQVTDSSINIHPTESLVVLKRARNVLIRTRIKECYDNARSLDETIHALEHRESLGDIMPTYDYGRLLELAEAILQRGENPLD